MGNDLRGPSQRPKGVSKNNPSPQTSFVLSIFTRTITTPVFSTGLAHHTTPHHTTPTTPAPRTERYKLPRPFSSPRDAPCPIIAPKSAARGNLLKPKTPPHANRYCSPAVMCPLTHGVAGLLFLERRNVPSRYSVNHLRAIGPL